jgi:hypothetical protein
MALNDLPLKIIAKVQAGKSVTPSELGTLIDIAKLREATRLAADKHAAACKADEQLVKLAVMAALNEQEVRGAAGREFSATIKTDEVPTVKDWTLFYEYIRANDAFDMLERRPSKAAVKARWDDGKSVPGVDKFPVDKLLFSKLKG